MIAEFTTDSPETFARQAKQIFEQTLEIERWEF